MRLAIAQLNCIVGDLAGNAQRILAAAHEARDLGADVLVTPELALAGYPPEDLLLRADFYRAAARELRRLAKDAPIALIVGHPHEDAAGTRYNAASLLRQGCVEATYAKQLLPNYEVFDEVRYFSAGSEPLVVEIKGVRCGINICADIWEPEPPAQARAAGAQLLLALNASPFHVGKQRHRIEVMQRRAYETGMAMVYVNLVGGQDELVFDGASFALDGDGQVTHQMAAFAESLRIIDIRLVNGRAQIVAGEIAPEWTPEAEAYAALKLGLVDYLDKNGFAEALVGLSGGIDSALVLCLAADALGAQRVRALMMPSPYTAPMSLTDASRLAANLGVRLDTVPIDALMQGFETTLKPLFNAPPATTAPPADTTFENLQARIRGMVLMALSNRSGALVLTTGNKSEMAVGYATLYGDMAGGFAVIKDVYKTFVYRLARWRNGQSAVIPQNIIDRPPSAELKADQTDQDSLPPYAVLDDIIEGVMMRDLSARQLVDLGHTRHDVERVLGLLKRSEYKRRQAPPGIRITARGFGKDWRYPLTSKHVEEW